VLPRGIAAEEAVELLAESAARHASGGDPLSADDGAHGESAG
jgi:hypothetical protein